MKAHRIQITIGQVNLYGYILPDGRKLLSGRNVTDSINEHNKSLSHFWGVKSLKDLPHMDASLRQIQADSA